MEIAAEPTLHDEYWKILDFEKLKYCFECGICTGSCPMAELLPEIYNPRVLIQEAIDRLVSSREKPVFSARRKRLQLLWVSATEGERLASKIKEMQAIVQSVTPEEIEKRNKLS